MKPLEMMTFLVVCAIYLEQVKMFDAITVLVIALGISICMGVLLIEALNNIFTKVKDTLDSDP